MNNINLLLKCLEDEISKIKVPAGSVSGEGYSVFRTEPCYPIIRESAI